MCSVSEIVNSTGGWGGGHDDGVDEGGRRGVVPKTPPPPQLYTPRGIRSLRLSTSAENGKVGRNREARDSWKLDLYGEETRDLALN